MDIPVVARNIHVLSMKERVPGAHGLLHSVSAEGSVEEPALLFSK